MAPRNFCAKKGERHCNPRRYSTRIEQSYGGVSLILGIDVGISGAVAVLDGGKLVDVFDMPTVTKIVSKKKRTRIDARALYELVHVFKPDHTFIEVVAARPNQGVSSMFAFGQASGIAEGVAACVTPEVTGVRPQTWKRHFKLTSEKGKSRELAMWQWPDLKDRFKRVKDDGRAEAALIGLWGYECILSKQPS
jgi:crossover junction endodeoxyribonuclease RuvC